MPEISSQYILAIGIVLLCSCLQSTVGFAFSLLSVPLLLFAGYSLPEAVAISITASATQRLFAMHRLRQHIPWRALMPLIGIAMLMVPLGVGIQYMLDQTVTPARIRQVVGAIILLALGLRLAFRAEAQAKLHWGWGLVAGASAGFLIGLANIGGPPLVLWCHAHKWTSARLRVAVLAISTPLIPAQVILQCLVYGAPIARAFIWSLGLAPASLLGGFIGLQIGKKLPVRGLKIIVYTLLLIIAAVAILKPFFNA